MSKLLQSIEQEFENISSHIMDRLFKKHNITPTRILDLNNDIDPVTNLVIDQIVNNISDNLNNINLLEEPVVEEPVVVE